MSPNLKIFPIILILAVIIVSGCITPDEITTTPETTTTSPEATTTIMTTTTRQTTTQGVATKGLFKLLISDTPADIGDFDSLKVSFSKMRIFKDNDSFDEFPLNNTVDLTQVVGEKAISILDISIDTGSYTKLELFASSVEGIVNVPSAA